MKRKAMAAGAENVLFDAPEESHAARTPPASWVLDDGLPPPTHSQVEYWRKLCGELTTPRERLTAGSGRPSWSRRAHIACPGPARSIVRRKRAWHLKRDWYTELPRCASEPCRPRARRWPPVLAPTCPATRRWRASRASAAGWMHSPSDGHASRFVGLVESGVGSAARRRRLCSTSCTNTTWSGTPPPASGRCRPRGRIASSPSGRRRPRGARGAAARSRAAEPYVAAAGIDTWYLNRIDPAGCHFRCGTSWTSCSSSAVEDEEEIDTRWVYDGTPLRMYRAGVNTQQGSGVSWSYILRNNSLALLVRRAPLGGIVAQARLAARNASGD